MLMMVANILFFLILVFLQTNLVQYIQIFGVRPDFTLLYLLFLANRSGPVQGMHLGFLSGLLQDIMSAAPPGFHATIRLITGVLVGMTASMMLSDPIVIPVILGLAGCLLNFLLASLVQVLFGINQTQLSLFSLEFLIFLLYNALLAPLMFALFSFLPWHKKGSKG